MKIHLANLANAIRNGVPIVYQPIVHLYLYIS